MAEEGVGEEGERKKKGMCRPSILGEEKLCGQFINITFKITPFSYSSRGCAHSCFEFEWIINYAPKAI